MGVEGGPQPNLKSRPGVSLSPTYGLDAGERDRLHNDHFLLAGGMLALLHAVFAVILKANQVLSGLALTLLGMVLTSFIGSSLVIVGPGVRLQVIPVAGLSDIPVIGDIFFRQSWMAYLAYVLVPVMWIWLYRTGSGLRSRAAGENAAAVDAAGIDVIRIRYLSTFFGGVLAGFGDAYLSLFYTPGWKETMTGGQGWVAIALVIFASWNPVRALLGAFLFGGPTALQFYFKEAAGIDMIPSFVLKMLPYVLTISVMVVVNARAGRQRGLLGPAALGHPFSRED